MPWQIAKTLCVSVLVVATGCASIQRPPKIQISSPLKKLPLGRSSQTEKKVEPQKVDQDESTKRRPLIAKQSDANASDSRHDAATRRFIETELRDANPREREVWEKYLATVDSAKATDALLGRRADIEKTQRKVPTNSEDLFASQEDVKHQPIKTVGHSVQFDSQQPLDTNSEAAKKNNLEDIVGTNSKEPATNSPPAQVEPTARKWSGQLKSLAEWENNPLNFSRENSTPTANGKTDRRVKPIPQIISIPFRGNSEADTQSEGTPENSKTKTIVFEKKEQEKQTTSADSMRIAPGAKLWEEELHKLVSLMEAEASASGSSGSGALSRDELRQQVALRMLYLVNDQTQLAMQPIPGLQPADQEFWTSIFWGLSNYLNEEGISPSERSTKTIEQLRSATHYLQIAAKLQLRNVSFCSRINGFGSFVPVDPKQLSAGQPVLIYCDVRNFQSESSDQNDFVTKLRSTIEIYQGSLDGQMIDRSSFPATEDHCQTIRTDYYNSYRIDLPTHLNSGPHVLKLTVYDEFSGKSATETIDFVIQ